METPKNGIQKIGTIQMMPVFWGFSMTSILSITQQLSLAAAIL
ncbi:hypothetical protein [Dehalobacter sp. 4CP]